MARTRPARRRDYTIRLTYHRPARVVVVDRRVCNCASSEEAIDFAWDQERLEKPDIQAQSAEIVSRR